MSKEIKFKVPFLPPSVNSAYYTDRWTGTRHKSKHYRNFVKQFEHYLPKEKIEGEVVVEFNFYYELYYKNGNRRRLDPNNFEKILMDTLVHYNIIQDDCWVRRTIIESYDLDGDSPREMWISIKPLTSE